jgi:hypothetical protein
VYELTGPRLLTFADAADEFEGDGTTRAPSAGQPRGVRRGAIEQGVPVEEVTPLTAVHPRSMVQRAPHKRCRTCARSAAETLRSSHDRPLRQV